MAILVSLLTTSAHALDGLIECPAGNEALPRVTETSYGVPLAETFAMDIAGLNVVTCGAVIVGATGISVVCDTTEGA